MTKLQRHILFNAIQNMCARSPPPASTSVGNAATLPVRELTRQHCTKSFRGVLEPTRYAGDERKRPGARRSTRRGPSTTWPNGGDRTVTEPRRGTLAGPLRPLPRVRLSGRSDRDGHSGVRPLRDRHRRRLDGRIDGARRLRVRKHADLRREPVLSPAASDLARGRLRRTFAPILVLRRRD